MAKQRANYVLLFPALFLLSACTVDVSRPRLPLPLLSHHRSNGLLNFSVKARLAAAR
jgi:outer membrane biogenesis lipoprotein LolB